MKQRIAIWAGVGFLVACCFVLYTFLAAPEDLRRTLHEPSIQVLVTTTLPITFFGRYFPMPFWLVPPLNATAYAFIGLLLETLRRKPKPGMAI